jgi:hypothetical protein
LQIHDQLWKKVHSFDKLADFACAALLNGQIMANLPGRGDKVLAIISGKLKKVIPGIPVPARFIVSKRLCTRQSDTSI